MRQNQFLNDSPSGAAERIDDRTRLECRICWYVYDPAEGDDYWHIPPGTPFSQLPDHWTCPRCDGEKAGFLVMEQ
jgi:rubredoxin